MGLYVAWDGNAINIVVFYSVLPQDSYFISMLFTEFLQGESNPGSPSQTHLGKHLFQIPFKGWFD